MTMRKALIPVAGIGTRFLPAIKAIPKETYTFADRPTIQYIVEALFSSAFERLIFVAGKGKSAIESGLKNSAETL